MTKLLRKTASNLLVATCLLACATAAMAQPVYLDPTASVSDRVDDLLSRMTLDEKIGQMTQANIGSVSPKSDITDYYLGSLLSGGGEAPATNSPLAWADMIDDFQDYALATTLQIPLLYGIDAVHGHNNVYGATIFPHNIGLGATRNPDLIRQTAEVTAIEVAATGAHWTFAPAVSVARNEWWGRTYESFSEDTALVSEMGVAALQGFQGTDLTADTSILGTVKHFAGDGGTDNGIDQGNTILDEATLREIHLAPYVDAIAAGARTIMVSYSSWNGVKLHGSQYLLTDVLKGEMGFDGFLISDWAGVDQVNGNYSVAVITAINAGVDMVMVPYNYINFITTLRNAVNAGQVSQARIDDAVRRILTVKFESGLFETPYADRHLLGQVGSAAHRAVARQAVAESLVVIKNDNQLVPLAKDLSRIHVAGKNADDLGNQCGGWTISWQGSSGATTIGTTIRQAIADTVSPGTTVSYSLDGSGAAGADVGIVVVGETPYAEGAGDDTNLSLDPSDLAAINNVRAAGIPVIVILVSGRPMYIESHLPNWDAFIAAWLPGTEGQGVADVLFGDVFSTGTLSHSWPKDFSVPVNFGDAGYDPLFPFGFSIYVEGDMDGDNMTDLWEVRNAFDPYDDGTLYPLLGPAGNPDGDIGDNLYEFESGTDPHSASSVFKVMSFQVDSAAPQDNAQVTVTTVPGYIYTIEYNDGDLENPSSWNAFTNQDNGIGTWLETSATESTFTFIDDFTPDTSGSGTLTKRFYRVLTALNVVTPPPPPPTPSIEIPGRVEAEDFTSQSGVQTETTTDTGGGLNVGYMANGDWMEYVLNSPAAGTYSIDIRIANNSGITGSLSFSADGNSITSPGISPTGGWQSWSTMTAGQIALPEGLVTLRVTVNSPGGDAMNLNWMEFTLVP
ncbi:carbohydrate-binding protein [Puniceicoccales bacterium CK1056]|uniref:beta-glucosidase n=1 Tax=Oceanipulchritudo coccoides TaxID=2706888 RepID=A0A6B2M3D6_9BACT|nr:glycoside hydrolase family 3 N-terminal domain-containing protein [Oceanipulchritudo coccoides]NDV62926.1 carbohydrate-binding protein [Oceanipulchritudo coccoides]